MFKGKNRAEGKKYISSQINIPEELNEKFEMARYKKCIEWNKQISKADLILECLKSMIFEADNGFFIGGIDESLLKNFKNKTNDNNQRKEIIQAGIEAFITTGKIKGPRVI